MKIKRLLSITLAFVMTFGMCSVAFASGDIPEGFTPIYTAEELNNIRSNLSGKYILMNDIDLSVYENWVPIGTSESPFNGVLDGNKFSVNNLSLISDVCTEETNNLALFGFIERASIFDVKLKNLLISVNYPYNSTYFIGGIAAYCIESNINSCDVKGEISVIAGGNVYAGGIVGFVSDEVQSTEIISCDSYAKIQANGENDSFWDPEVVQYTYVGGIAGNVCSANMIYKCANRGEISVKSINTGSVGSIVGNANDVKISKCVNTKKIIAEGTCEINEIEIGMPLWNRILLFFTSIFSFLEDRFK